MYKCIVIIAIDGRAHARTVDGVCESSEDAKLATSRFEEVFQRETERARDSRERQAAQGLKQVYPEREEDRERERERQAAALASCGWARGRRDVGQLQCEGLLSVPTLQ